ncbi:MAG: type II toxin-antitoxin system RelE family toxin [Planctomycetaceae bacterium]
MYELRILDAASGELKGLDASVGRRIVKRIDWLAANLDDIQPEALTGDLAGLFKLRVGDDRVVYEILRDEQVIVIHLIGHRKDVYRRR